MKCDFGMIKILTKFMPPAYKKVARSVGYALLLADDSAWEGLTAIIYAWLPSEERSAMARAVLRSLSSEQVVLVAEAALPEGTGGPIAPLFGFMDEAAFWADAAEPEELEAYCLASFTAMKVDRQAAFLDYVQGRQAA